MPTPTWERLSASRRAAVIMAAETEFADNGFSKGSLNVIARNAGVAKGSLFQYFDDKVDLFGHIVNLVADRIGEAIERRSLELAWSAGFFPAFTELLDEWMAYFRANPRDRSLTVRASLEFDPDTRAVVSNVVDLRYQNFVRPLLESARDQGWLRPDADLDAFLSLLVLLLPHLADAGLRSVDPVFDGGGSPSADSDRAGVRRLMSVFADAFGAPAAAADSFPSAGDEQRRAEHGVVDVDA